MQKDTNPTVVKMDGRNETFDMGKIASSIWKAASNVGGKDKSKAHMLGIKVVEMINGKVNGEPIKTAFIGEIVEKVLIENGHASTAKEFIRYRENKKHMRQDKESLGVVDDVGLSYNTLYILKERYLKRNEKGKIVETPKQMIERIAKFVSGAEKGKK